MSRNGGQISLKDTFGNPVTVTGNRLDVTTEIVSNTGEPVGVTDGNLDVMLGDPTTPPIDTYFLQEISPYTISADTLQSTASVLYYTFEATAGHGIAAGDEIILLDVIANKEFYAEVLTVDVNTITVDRPIDHLFPAATAIGRIVNSNMAVDGSVTPQIFTVRGGTTPIDLTRFIISMTAGTSMDDARFGGQVALTRGFVFRAIDGFNKTIFNFKTNGEIGNFCFDVRYADKAPAGSFGFSARVTFGGQSKHGVVLRVEGGDVLQWVVQDDLTDNDTVKVVAQGHDTSGEV